MNNSIDNNDVQKNIIDQAEHHFPSNLRPASPANARAFDEAKAKFIQRLRSKTASNGENSNTPETSGRCGRDLPPQPDPTGREADATRTQSGSVRTEADDADDPVPPAVRAAMNCVARFNADRAAAKASHQAAEQEDLLAALDPRSPLDQLSSDKQRLLYDAILQFGPAAVLAAISQPEPDGWNITPGVTSLKRFRDRYARRSQTQKKNDIALIAQNVLNDSPVADEGYLQASERLLKIRLLETVNDPASKTGDIRDLYHALTRLRSQVLAEKRLHLAEQKQKS